jgi:hypothetical protein
MTEGAIRFLLTAVFTIKHLPFITFRHKKIHIAKHFFKTDNDHLVRKSPAARNPKVYNHLHKCSNGPLTEAVQYTQSHTISLRTTLILLSHVRYVLLGAFRLQLCLYFSSHMRAAYPDNLIPVQVYRPHSGWRVQIKKLWSPGLWHRIVT